jgi:rhodanese-related sulfurtransferase
LCGYLFLCFGLFFDSIHINPILHLGRFDFLLHSLTDKNGMCLIETRGRGATCMTNETAKTSATDYAGDVTPQQAFDALKRDAKAALVDVRTQAEWSFVGVPDLRAAARQPVLVEWQTFPAMARNPDFAAELARAGIGKGQPLYFLCRSGARSRSAAIAMTGLGYGPCYNVAGGFEGNRDSDGHRGTVEGWKAAGCPWRQD